jgi:hypothetical protein
MSRIENPIASRTLNCLVSGIREEVVASLGHPQLEDDYFICEYEISVAGKRETYKIAGKDAIHALQLAMFMIGSTLASLPGASNWTWDGESHTGFPTSLSEPIVGLHM